MTYRFELTDDGRDFRAHLDALDAAAERAFRAQPFAARMAVIGIGRLAAAEVELCRHRFQQDRALRHMVARYAERIQYEAFIDIGLGRAIERKRAWHRGCVALELDALVRGLNGR